MSKKSDRIMAAVLFGGACVGVIAFTCWRMNVNSYNRQKYVAMYFEESSAAEESKKESEKAEEEAFWARPSVVEIMLPTEMPTASETEVGAEMSLPMETETSTECPTEPFIAPTTAIPATEVQIIVEATNTPQIADISLTAEEEQLLMRVASLEAGNQGWQGMALVMNVVLNRRQAWGLSIHDVIYAPGQFSVIGCDKWNSGFIATEAPIALQAVKDGLTKSQAEELEIETIEKYKAADPEKVLNISKGGTATFEGLSHTEEYKERMRRLNTGKKFSKEHLQNIKIAREKTSTKVTGTDADGNKTEYKSLHDAAEKVGGFATNISRAIKSGKNYKGFSWAESERRGVV